MSGQRVSMGDATGAINLQLFGAPSRGDIGAATGTDPPLGPGRFCRGTQTRPRPLAPVVSGPRAPEGDAGALRRRLQLQSRNENTAQGARSVASGYAAFSHRHTGPGPSRRLSGPRLNLGSCDRSGDVRFQRAAAVPGRRSQDRVLRVLTRSARSYSGCGVLSQVAPGPWCVCSARSRLDRGVCAQPGRAWTVVCVLSQVAPGPWCACSVRSRLGHGVRAQSGRAWATVCVLSRVAPGSRCDQAAARSCESNASFSANPPPNPVRLPSAPITRWQGTISAMGLLAFAMPTARAAPGRPIALAISP